MGNQKTFLIFLTVIGITVSSFSQQVKEMAQVKGGNYIPLYGTDSTKVEVHTFLLDRYPVTNLEFLQFVQENPKWKKSKAIKIFADERYLYNWENDDSFNKNMSPDSPVTNVSWFAAKNYCECQGKRLPTMDEWEYAARADEETPDARVKESYNQKILSWYESPNSQNNNVGSTFKNYWGIYDMHGLVWEWTSDFNSVMISGESRAGSDADRNLFCGSGALGATDLMNYAAFMRYAFRGSIKATYSIKNLGFRCARDVDNL